MTPPDSVGKVVAKNDWQFILGRRNADGLSADRVYWCAETGAIRIETTSDGRFRAGEGPEIRKPRLQALDRQRQEECEALRVKANTLGDGYLDASHRAQAAEAALAEARAAAEGVERDAARYRWLRDNCKRERYSDMPHNKWAPSLDIDFEANGHDLDAAIDAALGGTGDA